MVRPEGKSTRAEAGDPSCCRGRHGMNRRNFLKACSCVPFLGLSKGASKVSPDDVSHKEVDCFERGRPIAIAIEDVGKDEYGWFWCGGVYPNSVKDFLANPVP